MITFIAFILTILGCVDWLMVGLLQYDFIAGFFGFQASIFSRIIYILFGIGAVYLTIRVIANKGTFKVFERKKKKEKDSQSVQSTPAPANVEASKEKVVEDYRNSLDNYDSDEDGFYNHENKDGLFDEHLKNR